MNISDYLKESSTTQMAFARMLGVTQGTVAFWLHNKPPTIERCIEIEKATGGKVTCEELRPDVDWAYLRGGDAPRSHPSPLSESGPGAKSASPIGDQASTAAPDQTGGCPCQGGARKTAAGERREVPVQLRTASRRFME